MHDVGESELGDDIDVDDDVGEADGDVARGATDALEHPTGIVIVPTSIEDSRAWGRVLDMERSNARQGPTPMALRLGMSLRYRTFPFLRKGLFWAWWVLVTIVERRVCAVDLTGRVL